MATAIQANPYITPDQSLEMDLTAETRSEYYRGEVFAMGGQA